MGRERPWFRKQTGSWYVTIAGEQKNLRTSDKEQAYDRWHKLLAGRGEDSDPATSASLPELDGELTAKEMLAEFLEYVEKNNKPSTYSFYSRYIKAFSGTIPDDLAAKDLKRRHVERWLQGTDHKSPAKRSAITTIKRACNWAVEQELLVVSPLNGLKKPPVRRRDTLLSDEQIQFILDHADPPFRDLLTIAMETGCRPQEVVAITAQHCNLKESVIEFDATENKTGSRTGEKRTIYLTDAAREIVERLCKKHPKGAILRNPAGNAWTSNAIRCRFRRMREQYSDQLPADLCLYHFRHAYATDALCNGVDTESLRLLMGHKGTDMITSHYSHLAKRRQHLLDAAKKARQGNPEKTG